METINITKKGMTTLLINAISIKLFLTFPRGMVQNSGSGAWVQGIYVSILALIIYLVTYKLYNHLEKKDVIDLSEEFGGKTLKIIVGLLVSAILTANISMSVRFFPESIRTYLLPTTPTEFILIFLGIAVIIGTYNGIESLSRLHALFIPFAGIIMALFLLLTLPHCHISNLFPILGTGTYNIFVNGFNQVSIFADIFLLNLLLPYCKSSKDAINSGFWAIIWGGISTIVISLIYCMVYPYPTSTKFIMPVYQLARLVRIGDFFQRAEAIFEFVWSISTIMYITTYICVICLVWQKTFKLKYHKPLIIPTTIIVISMAFLPQSIVAMLRNDLLIKNIIYPIAFLLPILLAIISNSKLRGHKT